MTMLPAPLFPLAQHAELGQNCFDGSIGADVVICIHISCQWGLIFSRPAQFHQLLWLYRSLSRILFYLRVNLYALFTFDVELKAT
jgi:hypothetical protein